MKKFVSIICAIALMVAAIIPVSTVVYAAPAVSVSVSKTNASVGDKVTVTVSITDGYAAQGYVSVSGGASPSGDQIFTLGTPAGQTNSMSFPYTVTSEGTCSFSASVSEAYDADMNDVSVSGGSASVNVSNGNGSAGNSSTGNTDTTDNQADDSKSSDTTLKSLYISNGTLEPAFSSSTKNYSTKVDYSVTSISISASPTHANATVASVSGNENLEVGENTIKIVVKAENGTTGTYTITVTRRTEDDPENTDVNVEPVVYSVNGNNWVVKNEIPQDNTPEGFEMSTIVVQNQEFVCLNATFGDLVLLYMATEDGSGFSYFIYDQKQDTAYEFVKISSEQHFIVPLLPTVDEVPEGYVEETLSIEGKGIITAYQKIENGQKLNRDKTNNDPESPDNTEGEGVGFFDLFSQEVIFADEISDLDFYYIYAMNDSGKKNWYMYDSVEGTYIRCELAETENVQEEAPVVEKKSDNKIFMIAIFSLAFIVLIFLYIIVTLIRKLKNVDEDLEDDFDENNDENNDEDDEEQELVEQQIIDEVAQDCEEASENESDPGEDVDSNIDMNPDEEKVLIEEEIAKKLNQELNQEINADLTNDENEQLSSEIISKLAAEVEALTAEKTPELIKEDDASNDIKFIDL